MCLFLMFAGCGGNSFNPPLSEVNGRVTLDDVPLPDAIITFVPNDGPSSGGFTDQDGRFNLLFKNGQPGAMIGVHSVRISTDINGTFLPENEKVPAKYNSESTLTVEVKEGLNSIPFHLTTE